MDKPQRCKRGRKPDERRQRVIARDILLKVLLDEAHVIAKNRRPKFGARWHSQPMKAQLQLHLLSYADTKSQISGWPAQSVRFTRARIHPIDPEPPLDDRQTGRSALALTL